MTILTKYRIYCNTESAWTEGWRDDTQGAPTQCFTDTGHSVNTSSVQEQEIIDVSNSRVTIEEENVPENETAVTGKFKCQGFAMSVPALTTQTLTVNWSFPISVMEIFFASKTENEGDVINTIVGPNTIVGTLTSNVANGDTTFDVALTVIQNAKIGYELLLDSTLIGQVTAIDSNGLTVTVDTATTTTYTSGQLVSIQVRTIKDVTCSGLEDRYTVGSSKVGGMYLKANTDVDVIYENKHATDTHNFRFEVEFVY